MISTCSVHGWNIHYTVWLFSLNCLMLQVSRTVSLRQSKQNSAGLLFNEVIMTQVQLFLRSCSIQLVQLHFLSLLSASCSQHMAACHRAPLLMTAMNCDNITGLALGFLMLPTSHEFASAAAAAFINQWYWRLHRVFYIYLSFLSMSPAERLLNSICCIRSFQLGVLDLNPCPEYSA